jgi:D-serine deaminase-like pyridoxal phosphate-dependent protein
MPYQPRPGAALDEIDTPALLLDLDAFEHNLRHMASFFADKPTSLRPHAKTHKCPEIAHRQLQAGAIGITCAKLGEAEVMVDAGVQDVLIANEVVGPIKVQRLAALSDRANIMVAVDNPANVAALSKACQDSQTTLRVLVEVDVGMGRCGVQRSEDALRLARQVIDAPALAFQGLMGYEGHLVMLPGAEERSSRVQEAMIPLLEGVELLDKHGIATEIVSGGGTGTYDMTGTSAPMTEIQAGSYVLMDTTYLRIRPEFRPALSLLSTVVSRPTPERVVTDAGMKVITKEFGWPAPIEPEGLAVQGLSEEHGKLLAEHPEQVDLSIGDRVRMIPSHCCTTMNLHDRLYVTRAGKLVDIWPIAARGRAQ